MNSQKILHITSVHTRYDTRILKKECVSLKQADFDVSLIVCDGNGNEIYNDIPIYDAGILPKKRIQRMIKGPQLLKKSIKKIKPDVVHLHDPELLFLGLWCAKKKIQVIYDAHENVPKQIQSKAYIPRFLRSILAFCLDHVELFAARRFSGIVSVTDEIVERFKRVNSNSILLRNYPVINSFTTPDYTNKNADIVYAGGITRIRGALEIAKAVKKTGMKVDFFGPIESDDLALEIKNISNGRIAIHGQIKQDELFSIFKKKTIGLILFHPVPNHLVSSPNKLFEYMASGMAVIASNFPQWKAIIEQAQCGICVDPLSIDEIADALLTLQNNKELCLQMGQNGRKAVEKNYSWETESTKLIDMYKRLQRETK